ncbi:O-antigen translocase [Chitinibacter fontanus]|uniref:O-antigen translocase n=1 Tax=Chitinibacter fontanus TaxID=1737446 RepID=A0A7D5V862_9NEIS|nr:O-antigen translocase [Chitinibacter fontanus]QLI80511.1 O-antigen translocase [Chitinibacter fontanus]
MKRFFTILASTGLLTLVRLSSGFIIAKIVATYTGPSGLAMLGQLQGLIAILFGIVTAPLGSGVVKYTAEYIADGYEACAPWWEASLKWLMLLLVMVVIPTLVLSGFISEILFESSGFYWLVCLVAILLPLASISALFVSIYNGMQDYKRYTILSSLSLVCATISIITLTIYFGLYGVLVGASIFSAVSGAFFICASLRQPWFKIKFWWGRANQSHFKQIGGFALMSIVGAICLPTSIVIVRSMLISYTGLEAAGHWQAAYKISEVYQAVITVAVGTFYLPPLASARGRKEIFNQLLIFAKLLFPVVVMVFVFGSIFRDQIVVLLFSKEFDVAADFVMLQLLGDAAKIISSLFVYPIIAKKGVRVFVVGELLYFLAITMSSYFFIRSFGVSGASLAYVMGSFIYLIYVAYSYKVFDF